MFGDIAYDIAFHLHQMTYTKKDEQYFFDKLKERFEGDYDSLVRDIRLYRLFTLTRSTLYYVYWTNLVYGKNNKIEKEKQLGRFSRRYNRLCNYNEFNIEHKSEEELGSIFEEYKRKQEMYNKK